MKTWVIYMFFSALALGLYDFCTKQSAKDNSPLPVVFLCTLCGTLFFLAMAAATGILGSAWTCTHRDYLLIWVKTLIVGCSWLCNYHALATLPLSIAAPVRATSPLWVLIGAVCIFHEIPTPWEGVGMALVLAGYYCFTVLGSKEGFAFTAHSGMKLILAGTLLGSISGLYDKFLLNSLGIPATTVQCHFAVDLVLFFGLAWGLRRLAGPMQPVQWRWWIPATGILLIIADCTYFHALNLPGVPISQAALVRRCSCIVTFLLSVFVLRERNPTAKAAALLLILAGVILMGLA